MGALGNRMVSSADGINRWMDRRQNELMDRWADSISTHVNKCHPVFMSNRKKQEEPRELPIGR